MTKLKEKSCSYPVSLFTARYHDNDWGLLLPDHPPEVTHSFFLWPYNTPKNIYSTYRHAHYQRNAMQEHWLRVWTMCFTLSCNVLFGFLVPLQQQSKWWSIRQEFLERGHELCVFFCPKKALLFGKNVTLWHEYFCSYFHLFELAYSLITFYNLGGCGSVGRAGCLPIRGSAFRSLAPLLCMPKRPWARCCIPTRSWSLRHWCVNVCVWVPDKQVGSL